jgi:hypothetical protein
VIFETPALPDGCRSSRLTSWQPPSNQRSTRRGWSWFNRAITSRAFTYIAAALFIVDGVARLLDDRTARGLANLGVAALIVALRQRTRRAALGESAPAERRGQWAADHPVLGALVLGLTWGAAMSVFFIVTKEGPIALALLLGLGTGLLFFGPATVLLARRYRQRDADATA